MNKRLKSEKNFQNYEKVTKAHQEKMDRMLLRELD